MGNLWDWLCNLGQQHVESKETKVVELVEEVPAEKFVDPETGREYKSARSLKSAITRRKNKSAGKTSKKKTKKSKK